MTQASLVSSVAAVLFATLCGAQDLDILAPPGDAPNYLQCKLDFDSMYGRQMKVVLARIELQEERLSDIEAARKELLDNKIFMGLGPSADSESAANWAIGLQAVDTVADIATSWMESAKGLKGTYGLLGKYDSGKLTRRNFYNGLKAGDFIEEVTSADGAAELMLTLTTGLTNISPLLSSVVSAAQGLSDGMKNHEAWLGYRDELTSSLQRLELEARVVQSKIRVDERRVYGELRAGFETFCAEERPPRADDVVLRVKSGQTAGFEVHSYARDLDGGPVVLVEVRNGNRGQGLRGRATVSTSAARPGQFLYTAPEKFEGTETIDYVVTDDESNRATATVTIHVSRAESAGAVAGADKGAPRPAAGIGSTANPGVDIEAIWARCRESADVTRCVDDGLAGKGSNSESGRVSAKCAYLMESIANDETSLIDAQKQAAANSNTPDAAMRAALARKTVLELRDRIDQSRREARANLCN